MAKITDFILWGNDGDRPTDHDADPDTGTAGRIWITTDALRQAFIDDGTDWVPLRIGSDAPREWIHYHILSVAVAGNGINRGQDTGQLFGFIANQDPPADADSFTAEVVLAAGDYTVEVYGKKGDNCGVLDLSLEGNPIATGVDFYSPTDDADQVIAQEDYTQFINGRQLLTCTVNGKNGASSDYKIPITYISFKPRY